MRPLGERTDHAPGTFCWTDLCTADVQGAIAFYATLLGWEPAEIPDTGGYTLMRLRGAEVCGISAASADSPALPRWTSWVSVADADATVARAVELGGAIAREGLEVMSRGRSAVVTDPQGAAVGLWQPHQFIGASVVNEVGAMVLNQLNTSDPAEAAHFYAELFGWEFAQVVEDPAPFWEINNGGRLNGGMMSLEPPAPPHWLTYFTSDDLDGSDALIVDMGGVVVVPPTQVATGRIMVARDLCFAFFALYEGVVDP